MHPKFISHLVNVTSIILGLIFIYAGCIKFTSPDLFLKDIESYRLFPYHANYIAAYLLPPLEIVVGVGIMIPVLRKESALIIGILNIVFILALCSAWYRGLDITCGCFGKSEIAANYPLLIVRDVLFLLMAIIVFWCRPRVGEISETYSEPEA